jgi:pimeloyl-ACP methyl ester carboxylesterase
MNRNVYKSENGRNVIETAYKDILEGYTAYPFEQFYAQTKIAQTHIIKFGDMSKPPLIMIHGSVSNSAAWLGCIPEFIEDFCIYCVDIPGEPGLSEPNRCILKSSEPYEWLSSLLDCLKIEKAFFLTMSLGSWYALNLAIHKPDKISALSMITSGGLVPAKKSFIFKSILYMMMGKPGQKLLNKAVYYKTEVPDEVLEFQAIVSKHFNPVIETLPIFSDEQLKNIASPIQFIGGENDSLINSVRTAERISNLFPHADVHVLKDTGHVIIDKFPVVKVFLKQYVS